MSWFIGWLERLKWWLEQVIPFTPDFTPPPSDCALAWQPSVWLPVFYGVADYAPAVTSESAEVEDVETAIAYPDTGPAQLKQSEAEAGGEAEQAFESRVPDAAGPPTRLQVFYPSLDGSVWDAAILAGCGHFPLVVFLHAGPRHVGRSRRDPRALCSVTAP
ncbi:hypothetical protein EV643_15021 [Kribbella sp. VKM Ac-2527]|uniref:Uncharacterized protein n=1 Tax=Kribbella caucasensis TaxID=2512215 RepID=A0A4R6IYS2_9ACTN|nr:hypothetical protein [Kribbella sp. VKM Ac-2527]TDO27963.1 hypothetical protein EV643_15021 [Kribbella sp. VKM Ac-2527]